MATATRDEVLSFMDAHGCGAAEASAHFCGNPSAATIRQWLKRRRDAKARDGVTAGRDGKRPRVVIVNSPALTVPHAAPKTTPGGHRDPIARAREAEALAAARLNGLGLSVKMDLRAFVVDTAAYLRAEARRAITPYPPAGDGADDEGKDERPAVDFRALAQAAHAVQTILEIAPGISSFDAETGGEVADTADENRRSREAMGLPVTTPAAPGPRLVTAPDDSA